MPGTRGFTANDIADAMQAKAQDAFGESFSSPFSVDAIEQHRAEVSFTVSVDYSFDYQSRAVSKATGPLYDRAHIRAVLDQRQGQLLQAPGYLREHTQNYLREHVGGYREPGRFRVLSDRQVYCSVEDCQGCQAQGRVKCNRCHGSGHNTCHMCHTSGRVTCDGCGGVRRHPYGCSRCGNAGKVICHTCHGGGRLVCHACRNGQVTCQSCNGACQLIYEYRLQAWAGTAVHYTWGAASAGWMLPAMNEAMHTPERHSVFCVDHIELHSDDPDVFVASGHVVAAQAAVSYQQASGTCRFIGAQLQAVFLDGVLSGGFKKAVEGVKDHQNIHQVNQASSSKIARQLISEMNQQSDVAHTTPVRKGIISAADAQAFLQSRQRTLQYILATRHQFRWGAVFAFACSLTGMLTVLYGLMSLFSAQIPNAMDGNKGYLGLFALAHNPGSVLAAFTQPLANLLDSTFAKGNYWQLLCWLLSALLFNRCLLPRVAPRLWGWAEGNLLRGVLLSVPGIALLGLFMAMHPSGHVLMQLSEFFPNSQISGGLGRMWQWGLTYVPQIFVLALAIALVRYKAAGVHWGQRMLRLLLQTRDVSGYQSRLR
ncbi:hypothetical protein [Pseudomonas sp. NPDC089406]|uniref:hypothetical protein n=1 Tax=Pseudomonas sp. NPDC089406 TaxID=3364463 RepID=UPI00384F16B9